VQKKLIVTLILLLTVQFKLFPRDRGEVYYEKVKKQYLNLMSSSTLQRNMENWNRVIAGFEGVGDAYNDSKKAPDGYFMAGEVCIDAYKKSNNDKYLQRAIINYSKLVQRYKRNSLADDAQIKIAEIYRVYRKDNERARQEYEKLIQKFPHGDQKKRAEFWVKKLTAKEVSKKVISQVSISKIDVISGENYTRVSIEMSGEAEYSHSILSEDKSADKPRRIVLDIKNAKIPPDLKEPIPVQDEHLLQIRSAQFTPEDVRIVLDLKSIEEYNVFYFEEPFRIIVDAMGTDYREKNIDTIIADMGNIEAIETEGQEEEAADIKEKVEKPLEGPAGKFHIFLDPGHGGEDPGAIGRNRRIKEKDVVLSIALELKQMLEEEGYLVSMSRDRDVFIPLPERTAMANRANADLFISIHANASRRKGAHGIETYFFDLSSDRDVLKLAAMENGVSIDKLDTLQFILTDMERTPIRNQSAMLASSIQENVCSNVNSDGFNSRNLGVKHGPFYVLKGARMPSILVETAFITNPKEEKLLASQNYKRQIAKGILDGIKKYIDNIKTNPVAFLP
jgi:N-acetylmuramoyl-L-alanine amidase